VGFPRAMSTLICKGPEMRTSSWPAGQGLRKQAGHMAASANATITEETTCQSGPSTYGNPKRFNQVGCRSNQVPLIVQPQEVRHWSGPQAPPPDGRLSGRTAEPPNPR